MKLVQIGILIALIVVGALLFQVYRGQQRQQVEAPVVQSAPPAAAPAAAESAPVAAPPEPAAAPARKAAEPRPAVARTKAAPQVAAPPAQPAPNVQAPRSEPREVAQVPAAAAAPSATQPPAAAPPPAPAAEARQAAPAQAPPPPAPRSVTIEAGTLISARLVDTLASDKVKAGDAFTATLDRPLVVDGLVIAERGARVTGKVVEAVESGRVRGVASLAIQLVELATSDGQRVTLQTDAFRKEADSTRKEDAAKVGGGAGLGAVIGAIAGGGKGAAIGAAIGGAAGAGTVAATRGKPAVLPSETRIDFRVSQPVTVTERR